MKEHIQHLGAYVDSTLPSDNFLFSSDIKAWITAPETRPTVRRQTWYKKKVVVLKVSE